MTIGERIKACREDADKTQQEIADLLGTTQQQYQLYESGKRQLPIQHLRTLCIFYSVSADYILGLPKGLNWPR